MHMASAPLARREPAPEMEALVEALFTFGSGSPPGTQHNLPIPMKPPSSPRAARGGWLLQPARAASPGRAAGERRRIMARRSPRRRRVGRPEPPSGSSRAAAASRRRGHAQQPRRVRLARGDPSAARDALERALALDGERTDASARARFNLGHACLALREPFDAAEHFRDLLSPSAADAPSVRVPGRRRGRRGRPTGRRVRAAAMARRHAPAVALYDAAIARFEGGRRAGRDPLQSRQLARRRRRPRRRRHRRLDDISPNGAVAGLFSPTPAATFFRCTPAGAWAGATRRRRRSRRRPRARLGRGRRRRAPAPPRCAAPTRPTPTTPRPRWPSTGTPRPSTTSCAGSATRKSRAGSPTPSSTRPARCAPRRARRGPGAGTGLARARCAVADFDEPSARRSMLRARRPGCTTRRLRPTRAPRSRTSRRARSTSS